MTIDTTDTETVDSTDSGTQYATTTRRHEMPDGTSLNTQQFRPVDAESAPVLLQRTPYGVPDAPTDPVANGALDREYAVVYEDTRGRGESDGAFEPWCHEGPDGAATIEWLADQPWVERIGLFGRSSAAQVQLLAAAERPRGLAAVCPVFSPSDVHRADFFQDGAMSAMTLVTWSFDWIARHTVDRLRRDDRLTTAQADTVNAALGDAVSDVPALVSHRPLVDLPEHVLGDALPKSVTPSEIVPHWEAWISRPRYDDYWRRFDVETRYDAIDVPGLHVTGWYELCQEGTLTNYAALSAGSKPQHLVVGPWAHLTTASTVGELDFGETASARAYGLAETQLDFFDTYVKGTPAGAFQETNTDSNTPRLVETFRTTVETRDGTSSGGGAWVRTADWPPQDTAIDRWHLRSEGAATTDLTDGRLTRSRPEKFEPVDEWTHDPSNPVPTRGGPLCCRDQDHTPGAVDQRSIEARDDVATYTTPPFASCIDLAGPVTANLTVGTTAQDADIVAKLVHVTDAGAYNLCEGIRRFSARHGRDRRSVVPTGEPLRIRVDLWSVHHRVPAGDRLRLEVASSNHPRFDAHPGTTDTWRAREAESKTAQQSLWHERDRESVLELTRRRS